MAWSNTKHVPTTLRRRILRRDGHACQRCGAQGVPLEVNHIIGLADGGTNHPDNLESLCVACHAPETRAQTARGHARRAAAGRLPTERHPGLL